MLSVACRNGGRRQLHIFIDCVCRRERRLSGLDISVDTTINKADTSTCIDSASAVMSATTV
jgi:hypothetical protein